MNDAITKKYDRNRVGENNSESGAKIFKELGKLAMSEVSILGNQVYGASINQYKEHRKHRNLEIEAMDSILMSLIINTSRKSMW